MAYATPESFTCSDACVPSNIRVREFGTGKSRRDTARNLGIEFNIVPNIGRDDGIDAVRLILPRCWFDEGKCQLGLDALTFYRKAYHERSARVYGQVLKTRRNNRVVRVERRVKIGTANRLKAALLASEDSETLNTSFVERLNLTIRQASAYLHRRSPCRGVLKKALQAQLRQRRTIRRPCVGARDADGRPSAHAARKAVARRAHGHAHLGSGPRTGGPSYLLNRHRRAGLLLRSVQSVAARDQREHEWPVTPVLAEGDRPGPLYPGPTKQDRTRAQHAATQDTRLSNAGGYTR